MPYTTDMKVWLLETGEREWIVHPGPAEAVIQYHRDLTDCGCEDGEEVTLLDADSELAIIARDEPGEPVLTKTCDEWARECREPLEIASTCF